MTPTAADWPARARRLTRRAQLATRRLGGPRAPAEPRRQDVHALVVADPVVASGLGAHWRQTLVAGPESVSVLSGTADADLVLVELPDPVPAAWWGKELVAAARARGLPMVLWDTAPHGARRRADHVAVLEAASGADHLATCAPGRLEAYTTGLPTTQVWELPLAVAAWQHLPGGRTGHVREVATLGPQPQGSPTPRAALEAAARGTALVAAPLAALEADLDGAVWVAASADGRASAARALRAQPELRDRQAHLARRAVLLRHTWADRAERVVDRLGLGRLAPDRSVTAVVPSRRPGQLAHVVDTVAGQLGVPVELVLVAHGFTAPQAELRARAADRGLSEVTVVEADAGMTLGACLNLGVAAASGRYTAKMDDDNLYGAHYLSDLVREFEMTDAQVVGKWTHYVHLAASDAVVLRFAGREHREVDLVQGGTIVMPTDALRATGFADLPRRVDTTLLERVRAEGGRVWSADRYNFVSRRGAPADHTWGITDQQLLTRASTVVFYGDPTRHTTI